MDISSDIDLLFRQYLNLSAFGFDEHEFRPQNHCTLLKRKRDADREDIILYAYGPYEGRLQITNIMRSGVSLSAVERILNAVVPDALREPMHIGTVSNISGYDKKQHALNAITEIKFMESYTLQEERLAHAAQFLRNYIIENIFPFLDKIVSVQFVNDEIINKVQQQNLSNYIPGFLMPYRKQVIMKLSGNPGYQEYVSWLSDLNKNDALETPAKYQQEYEFHVALTEFLK